MTTTTILDNWTTGSTSNVDGRTADTTGGVWTEVEVTGGAGPNSGGRVSTSGFAYATTGLFAAVNAAALGASQWDVALEISRPSSIFPMTRVWGDCSSAGAGGYGFLIHNFNDEVRIYRNATNFTGLGTQVASVSHTQPTGTSTYTLQRRNVGADAVIKVFRNGVELLSYTDTSPLSSGTRVAFGFDGSGASDGNLLTLTATYEEGGGGGGSSRGSLVGGRLTRGILTRGRLHA